MDSSRSRANARGCLLANSTHPAVLGAPKGIRLGHSAVVGDQPVPALIDQHDGSGVSALARVSYGGQGGSGGVVRCGLDVHHNEVQGQVSTRAVQMIID